MYLILRTFRKNGFCSLEIAKQILTVNSYLGGTNKFSSSIIKVAIKEEQTLYFGDENVDEVMRGHPRESQSN